MRFDDMLATVLAQPLDSQSARRAAWRQAIDLLAQHRSSDDDAVCDAAADLVRSVRAEMPIGSRIAAARALIGQRVPPALVALFAEESAPIAAPVLTGARLHDDEWIALLPRLSPTARSLLRHRRDLTPRVAQALAQFGAVDLVLGEIAPVVVPVIAPVVEPIAPPVEPIAEPGAPAPRPAATGDAQIRDLVARIEAFRRHAGARSEAPGAQIELRADGFRFETSAAGVIVWIEGAPRNALIGETIALPAEPQSPGVDGQAAGAYRQRAPFRDARLLVAGIGGAAGEWLISAVPVFDPIDGRFTGYRGAARRPRADEVAAGAGARVGLFGTGLPADSLRQLVHELRTPLNAIIGFSEMIERQMLGPAPEGSRGRAADIQVQAARLLAAIDDLDMAARVETRGIDMAGTNDVAAAHVLRRLDAAHAAGAAARGAALTLALVADPGVPAAEAGLVERMFSRLLAATIGLAVSGETIAATLDRDVARSALRLDVTRPRALAGREERDLLDPGFTPDGDWPDGPALGLGFALRLVRNLAVAAGGTLDIAEDRFILRLPASATSESIEQDHG